MKFYILKKNRIPAYIIGVAADLLGASFKFRGFENVDLKKGGVVVINHQSAPDIARNILITYFKK